MNLDSIVDVKSQSLQAKILLVVRDFASDAARAIIIVRITAIIITRIA